MYFSLTLGLVFWPIQVESSSRGFPCSCANLTEFTYIICISMVGIKITSNSMNLVKNVTDESCLSRSLIHSSFYCINSDCGGYVSVTIEKKDGVWKKEEESKPE